MAGLGYKTWTQERLTAAQLQGYLQDQAVLVFGTAAARGTAIPAPTEGMTSKLLDLDVIEDYTGGAWRRRVNGDSVGWTAGSRAATNNYDLATLTINPGRPYRCTVVAAGTVSVNANSRGSLRILDNGNPRGTDQIELSGTARDVSVLCVRSFTAPDGVARTVKANLEVLAGSITTYTDDIHAYLQYDWWAL